MSALSGPHFQDDQEKKEQRLCQKRAMATYSLFTAPTLPNACPRTPLRSLIRTVEAAAIGDISENSLHASEPGAAHPPGPAPAAVKGETRALGSPSRPARAPPRAPPAGTEQPSARARCRDVAALRGRDGGRRVVLGGLETSPGEPRRRRRQSRDRGRPPARASTARLLPSAPRRSFLLARLPFPPPPRPSAGGPGLQLSPRTLRPGPTPPHLPRDLSLRAQDLRTRSWLRAQPPGRPED
ncbi:hypothetical protein J1605_005338 [Eschrichtius robustus]|uniref:Uncharacterized protein n=1 Tax=Eschrichtius robustus TaxID=9764 RepID=A0AB34HB13_ESCRO|nr:hypothetical protein J1605_005338 [Eschrichtius robustus]